MRALVLSEFDGPLELREVPTPEIGPRDALVRVRNIGVCGTDLKIRAGRMGLDALPLIMGHEVAGEVAAVGEAVTDFAPGDRVAVAFYVTCGRCRYCREGRDTLCDCRFAKGQVPSFSCRRTNSVAKTDFPPAKSKSELSTLQRYSPLS